MKRSGSSNEQVIGILKEHEAGAPTSEESDPPSMV